MQSEKPLTHAEGPLPLPTVLNMTHPLRSVGKKLVYSRFMQTAEYAKVSDERIAGEMTLMIGGKKLMDEVY